MTGIGFLGVGVIFKSKSGIEGITTGAVIWFTAAVGMACGFEQYILATTCILLYVITMCGVKVLHQLVDAVSDSDADSK